MIALAVKKQEYISISEISNELHISNKYLEKIVAMLNKAKFIVSQKGTNGGYTLSRNPDQYTIAEILELTQDAPNLAPCQKNPNSCAHIHDCTTIGYWEALQKSIYDHLNSVTLKDIIDKTF